MHTDSDSGAFFFAVAAEAMRRILVDNAVRKRRLKRGGQHRRVELDSQRSFSDSKTQDLLAVDEALGRLAREDPQAAELVKLRLFAPVSRTWADRVRMKDRQRRGPGDCPDAYGQGEALVRDASAHHLHRTFRRRDEGIYVVVWSDVGDGAHRPNGVRAGASPRSSSIARAILGQVCVETAHLCADAGSIVRTHRNTGRLAMTIWLLCSGSSQGRHEY